MTPTDAGPFPHPDTKRKARPLSQEAGTTTQTIDDVEQLRDLTNTLTIAEETAVLIGTNGDVWRIDGPFLSCLTRIDADFNHPHMYHVHGDDAIGAFLPLALVWTGPYLP